MSPDAFQKAMLRGMAASPFVAKSTDFIYIRGSTRIPLTGCPVEVSTNALEVKETGAHPEHVLKTHIPKTQLTFTPNHELDAVEYKGRHYTFKLTGGDVEHSAAWCLEARSPLR